MRRGAGQYAAQPAILLASPRFYLQLDQPLLLSMLSRLDRRSLVAAAASCRHLREVTRDVAPGLKLSLFPHQVGRVGGLCLLVYSL